MQHLLEKDADESPFLVFASRTGLAAALRPPRGPAPLRVKRSIESIGLQPCFIPSSAPRVRPVAPADRVRPPRVAAKMPYVPASPSSSPTQTTTIPSDRSSPRFDSHMRPPRHHTRSHSSDALMMNMTSVSPLSGFIFVQPASPDDHSYQHTQPWPDLDEGTSSSGGSSSSLSISPKRTKGGVVIHGFTPAPEGMNGHHHTFDSYTLDNGAPKAIPIPPKPRQLQVTTPTGSTTTSPSSSPQASRSMIRSAFSDKKTPMVRKKSGELVRSSLKALTGVVETNRNTRARSAPATPTCPKYVHFDTQLEHVKLFLAQQRPTAVSRNGSPVETETEDEPESFPFPAMADSQPGQLVVRLPNFPKGFKPEQEAGLETCEMASDGKSLRGVVRVKNMSFHKWVAIRFTLDSWQTVSEVSAEYLDSPTATHDRFVFSIKLQDLLAKIEEKTMFLAIRYTVEGREIWDNNNGNDYRIEFLRSRPRERPVARGRQTWSVTNAGQAEDRMADLRRELDRLVADDLDRTPLPTRQRQQIGQRQSNGSSSHQQNDSLSNRYDFGASLKQYSSPRGPAPETTVKQPGIPAYGSTQLVNGMPVSVFYESPTVANGVVAVSPSNLTYSPPMPKSSLPPINPAASPQPSSLFSYMDGPYPSPPGAGPPLYSTMATTQKAQRPPSPPHEHEMAISHMYSSGSEDHHRDFRHHTYPQHRQGQAGLTSPASHYLPLLQQVFREPQRQYSPFSSPLMSPAMSPVVSPRPSPGVSPRDSPGVSPPGSPPRVYSPPSKTARLPRMPAEQPSPSDSGSISSLSSVESDMPPSLLESPSSPYINMAKGSQDDLHTFLDRFCFHTSAATPSILGLHDANGSTLSPQDLSTTPRRLSPLNAANPVSCSASFFAATAQGGSPQAASPVRPSSPVRMDSRFGSAIPASTPILG